ncbi:MAG: hypothetical protein R3F11_19265 [Verrucomicrobiales bacterium]
MSDIEFDCPKCRQPLVVEAEAGGLEVPCPLCSELIDIPLTSSLKIGSSAEGSPPPEGFAARRIATARSNVAAERWVARGLQKGRADKGKNRGRRAARRAGDPANPAAAWDG